MPTLLHVNASPRGTDSKSLAIAHAFLDAYRARHPELKVDTWNLFTDPLPDYAAAAAAAKMAAITGQERTAEQEAEWAKDKLVFDRFIGADEYLFNVPMWNHGIPHVLKHWIDIITQPGWVFGFHPEHGYSGLVEDKRAAVVYTSGVYRPGRPPAFGSDFHSTYFDDWLRFIGVTDSVSIYHSGNDSPNPALAAEALRAVQDQARELAATW